MASTTTNKKGIVDFLWEWAESNGEWSKLLISKIVGTENDLISADRQIVFNYFLQSIKLHSGLPALTTSKPSYIPSNKRIELETLSDISGVNRLAKNQTINFSENLTVIFGENGTGKTGYGRILKTLGFSYDNNNNILSDIFEKTLPQSATIKFKSNSVPQTFNWDGKNKNSELENISVFNNNCVQISLSDRQLIVTPIGFHLFNLITSELNKLEELLIKKIASYPISLPWANTLNNGTIQQVFISKLSNSSTEQKLIELSIFSNIQEQELKDKENELSNLNKTLLETEIKNYNSSIIELSTISSKIKIAQTIFNSTSWDLLIKYNKEILELESRTQKGIKEIAETNGIKFYETEQFHLFIKSAEEYIKIIDELDYPNDKDNCIYCLQPLETSAKELLLSYRNLLNDKTQDDLSSLKQQKTSLINQILEIETNHIIHQPTFGVDAETKSIQPIEITEYNKNLEALKKSFVSDKIIIGSIFNFDYTKYSIFFEDKKIEINKILDLKKDILINLSAKEIELKNKINELKDRKLLSTKTVEIKTAITNHKIVSTLNSNSNCFSTNSISRKTTEARTELVQLNFNNLFKDELKAFKKGHIPVDLSFGTNKGNSKISHKINSYSLTDILSEGEQKAIALAEFLTELQLDNIKAPVIFDDPVNSLDHNIIDDVARRLIKLSNERQVVVFTHSVLLFNSFLYLSKQSSFKTYSYKFYNTKNEYLETGFINEIDEELNSAPKYIKEINKLLNLPTKERPELEVAEDCYGYLRSAIELFVEQEIFQGTIKRYQKNVALTQFVKINGDKLNLHKDKINEIFERCCGFIKGHSNPEEIHNDPTIIDLKADFEEFKDIRNSFLN
nr:AAA family ATPase [uncultured Flavobacterium sp.]